MTPFYWKTPVEHNVDTALWHSLLCLLSNHFIIEQGYVFSFISHNMSQCTSWHQHHSTHPHTPHRGHHGSSSVPWLEGFCRFPFHGTQPVTWELRTIPAARLFLYTKSKSGVRNIACQIKTKDRLVDIIKKVGPPWSTLCELLVGGGTAGCLCLVSDNRPSFRKKHEAIRKKCQPRAPFLCRARKWKIDSEILKCFSQPHFWLSGGF